MARKLGELLFPERWRPETQRGLCHVTEDFDGCPLERDGFRVQRARGIPQQVRPGQQRIAANVISGGSEV